MDVKELMQKVVNLSFEEKVSVGKDALCETIDILKKHELKDDDIAPFIFALVKLFVSADKKCSKDELNLVNAITDLNMSYDDFFDLTNNGSDPRFVTEFDELIDTLEADEKSSICLFGLCILAADDTITAQEQQLFLRILN